MKKIIIAIKNDFIRETYLEVFQRSNFHVIQSKSGNDVLSLVNKEKPDAIIADVELDDINGFELIKKLREKKTNSRIPVIIFAQIEREDQKNKAIDLEAKDFIVGTNITPAEAVRKIRIILGEQKSYTLVPQKNLYGAKDLITDLGFDYSFKCPFCGSDLAFLLIRDFSRGEKYFIVSVVCPKCKRQIYNSNL